VAQGVCIVKALVVDDDSFVRRQTLLTKACMIHDLKTQQP
jgi:hypothetical protein